MKGNVSQNGAMVAIICAVEGEREENQDLKSFVIHIRELSDFQELWEEKWVEMENEYLMESFQ